MSDTRTDRSIRQRAGSGSAHLLSIGTMPTCEAGLSSFFDITSSAPTEHRFPPHETTDRRLYSAAGMLCGGQINMHMPYHLQIYDSLLGLHQTLILCKPSEHGCCHRDLSDSVFESSSC